MIQDTRPKIHMALGRNETASIPSQESDNLRIRV
jgi:hypothetical protein